MGKSTRKVVCSVCGKKGSVAVSKDGRIADRRWSFFGAFNVGLEHAPQELRPESEEEARSRSAKLEHWECDDCFKEMEKLAGK